MEQDAMVLRDIIDAGGLAYTLHPTPSTFNSRSSTMNIEP
jgi:hypothetical protein